MFTIMEKVTINFFGQIIKIFVIFNVSRVQSQSPEDTDFLNFTVIAHPWVRYYTQDYNRMCPYTEMCDVLVDVDPSVLGTYTEGPCCGKCECGNDCLNTRDCCPDRLPRLLTSGEVKAVYDLPVQCIHAQFRAYDQRRYNGKSYFMITRCADDYFDRDVIKKCQLEYEDFDLVNDIPNFLPVTDKTENMTYKNKYCANCNHAFDSNLVYWEAKVGIFNTEVNIQKLADIQMLFRMDASSNVVFEIPRQLWYVEYIELCDAYIDRCNVTGLWDIRNPDIESMCVSYLSQYKGYKNIHCYICNGFPESTIEQICDESLESGFQPKSFISLLDFNNLESDRQPQDPVADTSCEDNQQYDTWAGICRDLYCPEPMFLNQNKCQPVFNELSEAQFDFTLRLIPLKGYIDIRIIQTLKEFFYTDIQIEEDMVFSSKTIYTAVQMFIKMNNSLSDWANEKAKQTSQSVFKEHIQYIAVRFIISASEIYNVTSFMTEVNDLLLGQNFDMTGGFHVEFTNISFTLYNMKLLIKVFPIEPPSTIPADELPVLPYNLQEYAFFEPFEDPVDGNAVLPVLPTSLHPYLDTIRIMPFLFCPYITLSNEEFTTQNDRTEIYMYLLNKNTYINTTNVVFSQNDSTIILCIRDYFSQPSSKNIVQKSNTLYNAEVILSVVCTTVSMLSLVIVLVTYGIFRSLKTLPGLNNMGLSLSLLLAQLFYLLGGMIEITMDWLCKTLGVVLHFSLLSSFFWMLVCTFHMMRTFVFISKMSAPEDKHSKFIKYTVFVSTASAFLVVVNIVVSVLDDSTIGYGAHTCYISSKHMILYTVALPVGLIILSNLVMFVYVMITVCNLPEVSKSTKHERNNMIIFAKLSTLTGITWVFAYLYQWTEIKAFSYMFIVANASQGLFIMFSFIANKRVSNMISTSYKSSSLYRSTHKSMLYSENRETQGRLQNTELNHL